MLIKRPNVGGLVATTALNTKINENQNKIPNVSDLVIPVVQLPGTSGLVTKQNIILKYQTLRKKYFNASDLDKKIAALATTAEQNRIVKLKMFQSSYFHGKSLFKDDDMQNYIVWKAVIRKIKTNYKRCYLRF